MSTDLHRQITDEIHDLHVLFERWFRAELPRTREAFARVERALAPGFGMITPRGEFFDRDGLIGMLWDAHGSTEERFEIEVQNVRPPREIRTNLVLVISEEWQWRGAVRSARLSSACLEPASGGWVWHHVHETWLPGRSPD